ncbi:MAG: hydrogenase [Methanobacteriaceae archaeon]|jgi:energy-converting hydrogenase A subunit K
MKKEQDTLFLMALVGVGAVIMCGLVVFKQWTIIFPLTLMMGFLAFLMIYQNRCRFIYISEDLEIYAFIIALTSFITAFILLYRPA